MTHDTEPVRAAEEPPRLVYRLCSLDDWQAAATVGVFLGSDQDRADGFIHLSGADQVPETAGRHYAGVRPLMLLTVDARRVDGEVRWEESRGGALFPHLYGTIPLEAVLAAYRLAEDRAGRLMVPPLMTMPGDLGP
ncbi:DUF952 domain-containing protein [Roseospira visakhapatnamensis]|uniref:Uncharacterized protein (DUF952 family) n=1 Tax=Roseospira visakhapatnamensis TaxID=390880 RepID=A0A7W6W9P3_9PROT|nr:DUF952 domain-containing protein [Roseospira visakhapatnamensis]MBB4265652.1 uncharacterized protein (DUF952 family) [Roseospira visakhapatnamensis]